MKKGKGHLAVGNMVGMVVLDSIAGYILEEEDSDGFSITFLLKSGGKATLYFNAKQMRGKAVEFVDQYLNTKNFHYNCAESCGNFVQDSDSDERDCGLRDSECWSCDKFEWPKEVSNE